MNTPTPRPKIMEISPYTPGLTKANNAPGTQVIKLSSNETPFGPSPNAIKAYHAMADQLHRYPHAEGLAEAIGQVQRLDPKRIVCGAGSDELISLLCLAYAGPGDDVLYSQYGFLMYPISSKAVGANPIAVPEQALKTDIQAIIKYVTPQTKIVFIANPNNPTGSYNTRAELIALRKALPSHILLVLDGAYQEYVEAGDYTDGMDLVHDSENIVVTRTFSKIYGLANLRVGWCYCPTAIAEVLHRVRGPFNLSGPGIAAGIAAIQDQTFIAKVKQHNTQWLPWFAKEVRNLGLIPHPSVANFILVSFPSGEKDAQHAHAFLMNQGIIARPVANYGLPHAIRFTIGLEEDMRRVVDVLKAFMSE